MDFKPYQYRVIKDFVIPEIVLDQSEEKKIPTAWQGL